METAAVWPASQKQTFSPTMGTMNCLYPGANGTGSNSAATPETFGIASLTLQTNQSPCTAQHTTRTSSAQNVRPCVAGTQTLQHQANRANTTLGTFEHGNDVSLSSSLNQDSSGLGSLLSDLTRSADVTPHGPAPTDISTRWKNGDLTAIESDTSDLCVDRSEQAGNMSHFTSPKSLYNYPLVNASTGTATSPCAPLQQDSHQTTERHSTPNEVNSAFHLVSGRQSRILEENLASVARYVEELTGGPSTNSGHSTSVVADRSSGSQSTMQAEQRHLASRAHLQQLNEQLAALRTEKGQESGIVDSQGQLLRLLANQFPDLVLPTNYLYNNTHHDASSWETNIPTSQMARTVDNLQQRTTSHEFRRSSSDLHRDSGVFNSSPIFSTVCDQGSEGGERHRSSYGTNVHDRRSQLDMLQSRHEDKQFASLHNTLRQPNSDRYLGATVDLSTQQATLAALIGLLGNNNQNAQKTALINSLLATLQDRKPSMSSTPVRNIPRALIRSYSDTTQMDPGTTKIQFPPERKMNEEVMMLAAPYQRLLGALETDIDRAANVYRNSASTIAQKSEAAYHWSGRLPVRVYRSMTFSRKVFLGGVPWDSTSDDLIMAFSRFGNVTVSWPQQEGGNVSSRGRTSAPKGYCYLIFDHESSVSELLAACVRDTSTGGDYYKISSSKFKAKDVQVIPWVISDSQYTKSGPYKPDSKRTVFIGALHGMITAEALVTIMNDLFGNVVFAALDTDKYKYPIGSGRVAFSSHKSYMRAVTANFVDVRTSKFVKTIQIDPYLEDSLCNSCFISPGIYFCRAFECFRYFCPACWQLWHNSTEALYTHKPLRRTFKPVLDRSWSMLSKF